MLIGITLDQHGPGAILLQNCGLLLENGHPICAQPATVEVKVDVGMNGICCLGRRAPLCSRASDGRLGIQRDGRLGIFGKDNISFAIAFLSLGV